MHLKYIPVGIPHWKICSKTAIGWSPSIFPDSQNYPTIVQSYKDKTIVYKTCKHDKVILIFKRAIFEIRNIDKRSRNILIVIRIFCSDFVNMLTYWSPTLRWPNILYFYLHHQILFSNIMTMNGNSNSF